MERYFMRLEYAGAPFHGFQRQPGLCTVQGEIEKVLTRITGEETRVAGAGRTDAGVHALGQAAAFDLEVEHDAGKLRAGINGLLRGRVSVTDMRAAPASFDPRRDALWREYRYFILNREAPSPLLEPYSHHVPFVLDLASMSRACSAFVGLHDFSAFRVQRDDSSSVREVFECEMGEEREGLLFFRVRANAFVHRMVRLMAGAALSVGSGRMSMDELEKHIGGGRRPCVEALPACGLLLWEVAYPPGLIDQRT
jgi:tRNA pseudouridine38-40 synthase